MLTAGTQADGPAALHLVPGTGQQLFLADTLRRITRFNSPDQHRPRRPRLNGHGRSPGPAPNSAWPVQPELFALPADTLPSKILWDDGPRLAWHAYLVAAVDRIGDLKGWSSDVRDSVVLTLEAVVAVHEAGTPVYSASRIAPLANGSHRNIARTLELLDYLGRLVDDRPDPDDVWLGERVSGLPDAIRADITEWASLLRRGDARHRPKSQLTWKNYLLQALPALTGWARTYATLREVTRDDVIAVLQSPTPRGGDGHTRLTALRSLFSFLKARGRLFTDPTRRLSRDVTRRPQPRIPTRLPEAVFTELAAHQPDAAEWLVLVLTGHHALSAPQMRELGLDDIDLPNRVLTVCGARRPMDDLTHAAISQYLDYRIRRWPRTANPHLLVTQQTVHHAGSSNLVGVRLSSAPPRGRTA